MSGNRALWMVGGGAAGFFGARMIPQNLPFLTPYNSGVPGYLLNVASGAAIAWVLHKFVNRDAGVGALVGTGVAVIARIITDNAGVATPSTTAGSSAAMSGLGSDLDFDLGYYGTEFPFPQGASAGPYGMFPSPPRGGSPAIATASTSVQAGQAAMAAASSGTPLAAGGVDRWGADRWG